MQRASRVRRFEQLTGQHFFTLFAVAFITGGGWTFKQHAISMLRASSAPQSMTLGLQHT